MSKKGSCMARSSMDLDNKLMISQIMQKFRPIAPKPLSSEGKSLSNDVVISTKKTGRIKRKYSRRKKKGLYKKKEEFVGENSGSIIDDEVVTTTLQLLPSKLSELEEVQADDQVDDEHTTLLKCPYNFLMRQEVRVVEFITGVCMEFHNNNLLLLGLSDNEKIKHLQQDLSNPWFVSDNLDKVVFVNEAYKKMVVFNHEDMKNNNCNLKVELVMKEKVVPNWFPKAFSCTARVIEYKWWRGQKKKLSRTIPCDVWRMEIGGFAWKLDIDTALGIGSSLGR